MKRRVCLSLAIVLAFNLGMIIWSWWLAEQAELSHPMQGQTVSVKGVDLHVLDSAADQQHTESVTAAHTLVLLHGASTSLLDFSTNLHPAFATRMRTLSIDRPGHGYSERGDANKLVIAYHLSLPDQNEWVSPAIQAHLIADALESAGIKKAILLGHSWAGSVVLAALLQDHEHIQAGVLIAGTTHPWQGTRPRHITLAATPVLGPLFSWQFIAPVGKLVLEKAVKGFFSPESVPANYIDNTGLDLSMRPWTFQHNAEDSTRLSDYLEQQSQRYHQINKPLLSIVGSEDHVVPAVNHHKRLAMQVPQLQTLEIQGAGHSPHHTRTTVVVNAIQAFVNGLD